jgi:hypothetical protein
MARIAITTASTAFLIMLPLVSGCGSSGATTTNAAEHLDGSSAGGDSGQPGDDATAGDDAGGSSSGGDDAGSSSGASSGASSSGGTSGGSSGGGPGTDAGVALNPLPTFPLAVSSDKHYLVDATGNPFFLQGDTAWELIPALSQADTTKYLDDRQSRGVTALLMELAEHKFTVHDPPWLDANGHSPFDGTIGSGSCASGTGTCDLSMPDSAYFANVDWVIQQAGARGMVVLLVPSYLGYGCGDEGWCAEMRTNGTTKLGAFGEFLGARYKDVPNIIWVNGGDDTPSGTDLGLVNALANGIIKGEGGGSGTHLMTAHWGEETSGAEVSGVPWLAIDTLYTYKDAQLYAEAQSDYARDKGVRPEFLIESIYENEHSSNATTVRNEMYGPVIGGEMGFVFGDNPMWFYGNAGDGNPGWSFATSQSGNHASWTKSLASQGAQDAARAGKFFRSIDWAHLQPDTSGAILTSGNGTGGITLASTPDGKLAVAYFYGSATATIDLTKFSGSVKAQWFDPSNATYATVSGSPFANSGSHAFKPTGNNATGLKDWVLLLQTQ